jgi:hypothetical protein
LYYENDEKESNYKKIKQGENKMRKGQLSREEAVERTSEILVDIVDTETADFTNRVQTDGDDSVEFSASITFEDADGNEGILTAYYYQSQADIDSVDDLGMLDWEVSGYEVE